MLGIDILNPPTLLIHRNRTKSNRFSIVSGAPVSLHDAFLKTPNFLLESKKLKKVHRIADQINSQSNFSSLTKTTKMDLLKGMVISGNLTNKKKLLDLDDWHEIEKDRDCVYLLNLLFGINRDSFIKEEDSLLNINLEQIEKLSDSADPDSSYDEELDIMSRDIEPDACFDLEEFNPSVLSSLQLEEITSVEMLIITRKNLDL